MATRTSQRYRNALGQEQGAARRMGGAYEERAQSYDPHAAAERQSQATLDSFFEQYGEDFASLRGSQVGSGRLNTGYGGQDEGRLQRDFMDRSSRAIAQNSLQASGLELQNNQSMGAYGSQAQGRYLDLLSGQLDRETAQKNAERQRRAGLYGGLGAAVGGVGGFLLGGPAGAAAGAKAGGALGRGLGG